MNERIEDLLYQSGLTASGCWEKFDDYDKDALEKFAQLIVRECARVAMRSVDDAEPKEAWYLIEEHFGVEE